MFVDIQKHFPWKDGSRRCVEQDFLLAEGDGERVEKLSAGDLFHLPLREQFSNLNLSSELFMRFLSCRKGIITTGI